MEAAHPLQNHPTILLNQRKRSEGDSVAITMVDLKDLDQVKSNQSMKKFKKRAVLL